MVSSSRRAAVRTTPSNASASVDVSFETEISSSLPFNGGAWNVNRPAFR